MLKNYIVNFTLQDGSITTVNIHKVFNEKEAVTLAFQKFIENEIIEKIEVRENNR